MGQGMKKASVKEGNVVEFGAGNRVILKKGINRRTNGLFIAMQSVVDGNESVYTEVPAYGIYKNRRKATEQLINWGLKQEEQEAVFRKALEVLEGRCDIAWDGELTMGKIYGGLRDGIKDRANNGKDIFDDDNYIYMRPDVFREIVAGIGDTGCAAKDVTAIKKQLSNSDLLWNDQERYDKLKNVGRDEAGKDRRVRFICIKKEAAFHGLDIGNPISGWLESTKGGEG